ncbi:MAG: hypothetical protein HY023_02355, partial [Chloroflexi bacterium]|nr:hypothetical protein [Chloroflexota bacterium]
ISVWDFFRHASVGFWAQGYTDNVPGRFIRAAEVWPRLEELGRLLSYFTASPIINALVLIGLPLLLINDVLRRPRRFDSLTDLGLTAFALAYLGAYWLLAFNLWDRYFLAILPLACLLLARAACHVSSVVFHVSRITHHVSRRAFPCTPAPRHPVTRRSPLIAFLPLFIAHCSLLVLLLPPALTAAHSGFPLGGDHEAYDGINEAARYLRTLPKGAVLYDHWLSWEWRYYLDEAAVYIVWMPDPQTLEADLRAFGRASPRYFVSPSWESDAEMQRAAAAAGFAFQPVLATHRRDGSVSFVVYRLVAGNR